MNSFGGCLSVKNCFFTSSPFDPTSLAYGLVAYLIRTILAVQGVSSTGKADFLRS